jgi:TPR repeat protein
MPVASREAEARADALILKAACEDKGVASACMGYALMLKYATATGKRDSEGGNPYWAKVRELKDLNGYRDASSDEGREVLRRTGEECDAGRARSCNQLGWAAYNGAQRSKSIKDALKAYARACDFGSAQGCRWAGHYAHVYEEIRNLAASERMLRRGCEGGNPGACSDLGLLLKDTKKDDAAAYALFERACNDGGRAACTHQGVALLARKDKAERARGVELIRASCEAGEEDGCFEHGRVLEKGDAGVKRSLPAAATAYAAACKGKNEEACEALSRLAGADRGDKCVLEPKRAKIDERSAGILKEACKKNRGAAWCRGVVACAAK